MTKKIIFPLAALILLSACAGKIGLQKRRYNKGYYFSVSKNQHAPQRDNHVASAKHETAKTKHQTVTPANVDVPATQQANANTIAQSVNTVEFAKAATAVKHTIAAKHPSAPVTASARLNHPVAMAFKQAVKPLAMPLNKAKSNDSDVALILLVILCLFPFINLIPVYIHDGKKVTMNFILTLILDFLLIVGVIFALLVVLDVVDLG